MSIRVPRWFGASLRFSVGAALILGSLLGNGGYTPPPDAIVAVNGVTITASDLDRLLKRQNQPAEPARRVKAIQFLVDQELLLQESLAHNVLYRDRLLRNIAVKAQIQRYLDNTLNDASSTDRTGPIRDDYDVLTRLLDTALDTEFSNATIEVNAEFAGLMKGSKYAPHLRN